MIDGVITQGLSQTAMAAATADDAELARVLESYLADLEVGRAASAAELVAAHPHLAERLEGCLASLRFVEQAGGAVRTSALAEPLDERATLGDFRLIRELGRGGMGIVYESEQLSLGRRVAVKVLPFAAMLDERQLARFKNEARAAASLHHGHIVPVFYVGAERGVHYYAMQFIEGRSLAEIVEQLRNADCGMRKERTRRSFRNPKSAIRNPKSTPARSRPSPRSPITPPPPTSAASPSWAFKPPRPSTTPTNRASSTAT